MKAYRIDIDSLRAIAVLAILIFHIDPRLSGGFIGVDVFFVISGFLITSILIRDFDAEKFNFAFFYAKRIKRLFPALFAMLFTCTLVVLLLGLSSEIEMFGKSVISSTLYVSNFFFLSESDYFGSDLELNPLLHTWSLSVEEQFYLLFPVFLFFIYRRFKSNIFLILCLTAAISFTLSEVLIENYKSTAFFISPSRFWQFLVGSLIALKLPNIKLSRSVAESLSISGLLIIIFCIAFYSSETEFPGVNAILPTLGAALVIISGSNSQTWSYSALSFSPLRFFGIISYSLYLWHWPVIVFYKVHINPNLDKFDKLSLFLVSILLGYLSWKFIETPARKRPIGKSSLPIYSGMALVSAVFIVFGISTINTNGYRFIFTESQLVAEDYLDYNLEVRQGQCFLSSKSNDINSFDTENCISSVKNKTNVLLMGDSHAAHYYTSLADMDINLSQSTSSGCKPTTEYKGSTYCTELMKRTIEKHISENNFDVILLSARWKESDLIPLLKTVKTIKQHTRKVVVLGPSIEYSQPLPLLLARSDESTNFNELSHYSSIKEIDNHFQRELLAAGIDYHSVLNIQCPRGDCITTTDSGTPVQFDYGHLTHAGANLITQQLAEKILSDES